MIVPDHPVIMIVPDCISSIPSNPKEEFLETIISHALPKPPHQFPIPLHPRNALAPKSSQQAPEPADENMR
jgi:hypothetical protein